MTYDLRFSSTASPPSPVRLFAGHINSYTDNLVRPLILMFLQVKNSIMSSQGIAIDHDQDILFAAGQDCRIRAWSLRTAAPLLPPLTCSSTPFSHVTNPFSAKFSEPVRVLQVTQEELGSGGTCLWAASDRDIFQYHLGQHSTSAVEY